MAHIEFLVETMVLSIHRPLRRSPSIRMSMSRRALDSQPASGFP